MTQYLTPPKTRGDDNGDDFDLDTLNFYGYSIEYLFDTAYYFERFGILPSAGGYDDQPARWFEAYANWCLLRDAVQKNIANTPKSLIP